jgi:hypothetical protein
MMQSDEKASMSQKIFDMGFAVETISVYLLCCGLNDMQRDISKSNLAVLWNDSAEALEDGLETLLHHHVLVRVISRGRAIDRFKIVEADRWHPPA